MKQTARELKDSPPKIYCKVINKSPLLQPLTELIYCSGQGKLQKSTKAFNCYKEKKGKKSKEEQKGTNSTGSRNSTGQDEQ